MAREYRFYGIKEANADVKATSEAINALLISAKVETIPVNGKPMPATSDDVPNADKIRAFAGTLQAGTSDAQVSKMAENNTLLAEQAATHERRAVTAETTLASLQAEHRATETELTTARANIATLTAATAELTNLRKAANDEAARLTGQLTALNTELSKRCLALDCLCDLRGADGNLLASTASKEDRLAAAERVAAADKLNSLCGAVNSTITRITGLDASQIPLNGQGLQQLIQGSPRVLEQYHSITNAADKTKFYREHAAEIDAAYRNQQASR